MLHKQVTIVLMAGLIVVPVVAPAQAPSNARQFVQDERQIAIDKKQIERDQQEIQNFEKLLKQMHATPLDQLAEYARLNDQLRSAMAREHEQAKAKLAQAGREVRQSRRELRGERHEATMTASAHDRVQTIDDRRDLRDDRGDRAAARNRVERMESLIAKSKALDSAVGQGHEEALVKNGRLMGEFLELMRSDLRATASELVEDRHERREDRRERITDRKD